jgi:glycerol-3-phosphate cytidylyltransferase
MVCVGFCAGAFDLLHAGHVLMLEDAKSQCDHLIVGLHTDPTLDRPDKNKPIQTTYERYLQLDACRFVDQIVPYDTEEDLYNILVTKDIDIRILGSDYENKEYTGQGLVPVYFHRRAHRFSSTDLRIRIYNKVAYPHLP